MCIRDRDHLLEEALHPRADISEPLPGHVFELGADLLRKTSLLPLRQRIGAGLELKAGLLVCLRRRVRLLTGDRPIVGRRERLQVILRCQGSAQFSELIIGVGNQQRLRAFIFTGRRPGLQRRVKSSKLFPVDGRVLLSQVVDIFKALELETRIPLLLVGLLDVGGLFNLLLDVLPD